MSEELKDINVHKKDVEDIGLIDLLQDFWHSRKFILKTILLFFTMGILVALLSKDYYTSTSTIVPITAGKSVGGNLGGLASLAGINLGALAGTGGEISPEIYPEIINSELYKLELLKTQINVKDSQDLVSYQYYYQELYNPGFLGNLMKYTIGLPKLIRSSFNNDENRTQLLKDTSLVRINKEQFGLIKKLEGQLELEVNERLGFISLSVTMPEAIASAQMARRAQELLQEYILKLKTQKSIEQLRYIEDRFYEKEKEFEEKKLKLALFQDRNNNINSALAKTKLLQLQSEYDLSFTVYNELAKQLETQRLQVKKDTPIFTIVKPVTIPNEKAGPKKSLILIGFLLVGLILSFGYVYIKGLYANFIGEWTRG